MQQEETSYKSGALTKKFLCMLWMFMYIYFINAASLLQILNSVGLLLNCKL